MPYREDPLLDIRTKVEALQDEVERLNKEVVKFKTNGRSAIRLAIANKIANFGFETVAGIVAALLILAVIGWGGFAIYMSSIHDYEPERCTYSYLDEKGWTVQGNIDWHEDRTYGTFKNIEDARLAARANHCPNLPEILEK